MSIAIDTSTPAPTSASGSPTSPVASSSFTPPDNSLVLVGVGSCEFAAAPVVSPTGVSDGTNIYTQLVEAAETVHAFAALYCHYYETSPGSIQVSVTLENEPSQGVNIVPVVLTDAASTQDGATATQNTSTEGPDIPVTTTADGSQVFAMICNDTNSTSPTVASGQTITFNGHSSFAIISGNSAWMQALSSPAGAPGTVTISDSAPSPILMAAAAAEILAASGGPTPNPQIASGFFAA